MYVIRIQNPSNKNKDNVEQRFHSVYSVVTCLTAILHNVFQSSMHALTIIVALILRFYVLSKMNKKQTAKVCQGRIRMINFTGENR